MDQTLQGFAPQLRGLAAPELRKDPVVNRWVIIAPERAQRPVAATPEPELIQEPCPFCEGHESETPHELLALRQPGTASDGPGWRVRVVPNKFPALHPAASLQARQEGVYESLSALGSHEVIVECPHHETSLAALEESAVREVLGIYRDRLRALRGVSGVAHGTIFKNSGAAAGASLAHAHSQLIATPLVPVGILDELAGAEQFYRGHGRCVFCAVLEQEQASPERVVLNTPQFLAIAPFASRFSFETWILPKRHRSHYEELDQEEIHDLGTVLKRVLQKLENALHRPAYNFILHSAPFGASSLAHFHWHLEILPRLVRVAGFEWGTGFCINAVPPEQAAAFLRKASPAPEP